MNNNILSKIGEKLFLNSQVGVFGKLTIDSIDIYTIGESPSRILSKKFRYSVDNLTWTDWLDLSLTNIQRMNGQSVDILFINFLFERSGSDESGIIEIGDINIDGDIVININDISTTSESIFKDLVENDAITSSVANNLLKKIFEKGVLPNYISRGDGKNQDFISFWYSICTYFSYVVALANKFDNILNEKEYLAEYIKQRGVAFSKSEITLLDLQYISNNFLDEIRKRGTKFANVDRDFKFLDGSSPEVDGEWLRLISKNHYDEFLVEYVKKEDCGYFIDKSSHMYNGTNYSTQINKTSENSKDFKSLTNFKTTHNDTNILDIIPHDGKDCLRIKSDDSGIDETFGLGYRNGSYDLELDDKFLTPVDVGMDYEITFSIKKEYLENDGKLSVSVDGFNINNFLQSYCFVDYKDNEPKNQFCKKDIDSICLVNDWYFLRFIIYTRGSICRKLLADENDFGITKLKFAKEISKIMPSIQISSSDGNSSIFIHDYKIRPLIRGKNIMQTLEYQKKNGELIIVQSDSYIKNPCFVQNNNSIITWMKNNSDKEDTFVNNFIDNYLIPYHKNLFVINLKPKTNDKQLLT